MPPDLSHTERSTIASIVDGISRRSQRRRSARRSGWVLLITAALSLPVISAALDDSITTVTATVRIGIAFALAAFVMLTMGSLMDHYRSEAALASIEAALLTARVTAESAMSHQETHTESETEALTDDHHSDR